MILWVCDRCGKQIDRFCRNNKYEITRAGAEDYGYSHDREYRKSIHDPKACYTERLSFCEECEAKLTDILDKELSGFPKAVTLNTEK